MEITTLENAIKLVKSSNGKIFSVVFVKKDGTDREMVCRLGVTKHLKGGELAFDPKEYDLLPVFDMQKKAYRMINLASIKKITFSEQSWVVV